MDQKALVRLFGANVRDLRMQRDWSQEQLSELAKVDRSYISDIERGECNPTLAIVAQVAGALGVTASRLFAEQGDEPAST